MYAEKSSLQQSSNTLAGRPIEDKSTSEVTQACDDLVSQVDFLSMRLSNFIERISPVSRASGSPGANPEAAPVSKYSAPVAVSIDFQRQRLQGLVETIMSADDLLALP